jgi:DNA modification methylase
MDKVFFGDCRETMKRLIAEGVKVQTCVTSPPYWGLRDYGAEGQLGLERTPQEYVENMVEVFGLVRELLSDDGTLWLNLGDSYSRDPGKGGSGPNGKHDYIPSYGDARKLMSESKGSSDGRVGRADRAPVRNGGEGLKPKDLVGIPWMVAFALRSQGWYLRQDIIWNKTNPMPESVTDRPTRSHEYIFLMSKNERYYYDHEAIKEAAVCGWNGSSFDDERDTTLHPNIGKKPRPSAAKGSFNGKTESMTDTGQNAFRHVTEKRNKRSVWTVSTVPYPGSHFAVFPPALIEPCIMAGSRTGDIVLDPFFGSGTTGQVAEQLGRQWIGCEIQTDYEPLQKQRTAQRGFAL